jgi:hypothetical protein
MIPIVVLIVALPVIGLCLYVLKRTGFAAWRRKMKDEVAKDTKRFSSDETIG